MPEVLTENRDVPYIALLVGFFLINTLLGLVIAASFFLTYQLSRRYGATSNSVILGWISSSCSFCDTNSDFIFLCCSAGLDSSDLNSAS